MDGSVVSFDKERLKREIALEIPRMRRYARALCRNDTQADDLVQGALVRALDKLHLYREEQKLREWLFVLLHNQYVNHVRKAVREKDHATIAANTMAMGHEASQQTSLSLRDLQRSLKKLPEEQRTVVLLIGLEGMSYEEVATVLKVPTGTVRSRLSRGRDALRQMMEEPDRRPQDGRSIRKLAAAS